MQNILRSPSVQDRNSRQWVNIYAVNFLRRKIPRCQQLASQKLYVSTIIWSAIWTLKKRREPGFQDGRKKHGGVSCNSWSRKVPRRSHAGYCSAIHRSTSKIQHGLVGGLAVNFETAALEINRLARCFGQNHGIRLRHWIISLYPNELTLPEIAAFARQACAFYAGKYQIVYAVHEDVPHPHIHFVMNYISYLDGSRYRGDKQDYWAYIKEFGDVTLVKGFCAILAADILR